MPQPKERVSLRDIATAIGVSHVTVSLALRGNPRIPEKRRDEIRETADRLGYRPDPMLSSLSAYRQARRAKDIRSTIAWLNQWPDPPQLRRLHEFDAYWRGAKEYAAQLGYRLEEFVLSPDLTAARLQQILLSRDVRGILVPPHSFGLHLPGFDWAHFSAVRLGVSARSVRTHVVTSDQMNCAATAFEHIWAKGYRRIAYVTAHSFERNTGGNFRAGYLSAQDTCVPPRRHLAPFLLGESSLTAEVRLFRRWLQKVRPDAILSSVAHLPELLHAVDCRCPQDVGVAALSLLDGHFSAGVDQNSFEIGRVALATLAGLIQQNERGIPQFARRILVEGRWVDGPSLPEKTGAS